MKSERIVLIGMPGCGKSSLASVLARKTGYCLFECDEIFEKTHGILIKDYFKKFGEKSFRIEENKILYDIMKNNKIIVSTGGGVILSEKNRKILFNDNVTTVYINSAPDIIYERIKNDKTRPLLQVQNPEEEIKKTINNREIYYKMADFEIINDNKTINETAGEIIQKVIKYEKN